MSNDNEISGTAYKKPSGWTIDLDDGGETSPLESSLEDRLEQLDADGQHVVARRLDDGIWRVVLA
jgi:hypothetical protein